MHCSGHHVPWAPDSGLAGSFLHSSSANIWKTALSPQTSPFLSFVFLFSLYPLCPPIERVFPPSSSHFIMPSSFTTTSFWVLTSYIPLTYTLTKSEGENIYYFRLYGITPVLIPFHVSWMCSSPAWPQQEFPASSMVILVFTCI